MASIKEIATAASDIIFSNEGSYGSINRDDNGALSVGKLQWHGERARALLLKIIEAIPQISAQLLGDIYTELMQGASWSQRVLDSEESNRVSALLLQERSKQIQDECAIEDICTDIERGVMYGLCHSGALIYFADGANQYGRYSQLWKDAVCKALEHGGDIEAMHNAILSLTSSHLQRRQRTYEKVRSLGICNEYLDGCEKAEDAEVNAQKEKKMTHTVVRGDTLSEISLQYGVDIESIIENNKAKYRNITRDHIVCGWVLEIPCIQTEDEYEQALKVLTDEGIVDSELVSKINNEAAVIALYRLWCSTKRVG
ncbi:MAG: LysM peptidoglycan-binding domain-containing protein [Clostridia bacterium]|nr:LysM peptidoglycan-binding domain-containing protein [Clostridia bacterium]